MTETASTPSQDIIKAGQASKLFDVFDPDGRKITCRILGTLDNYRMMKSLGYNSGNPGVVHFATVAHMVIQIDDKPVPTPSNDKDIEASIRKLGDIGFNAVMAEITRRDMEAMKALSNAISVMEAEAEAAAEVEKARELAKN